MCETRTLNLHAQLVSHMGDTLGVDLTTAMQRGDLSPELWRDAVLACTGCTQPCDCKDWLAEHAQTGAKAPPDYCRNTEMFETLATEEHRRHPAQ